MNEMKRAVKCRCGRTITALLIQTNVPRTAPVYVFMCPTCDKTA